MANPFANAPHYTSELNGAFLFGIQTGQKTYEQGGVDQMKYITLNQLTSFVRGTFGNLWTYRGEYASALPTNLAVNDYFLATGTFTVDGVTFTSGHLYAYNGSAWSDITNVLVQYVRNDDFEDFKEDVDAIEERVTTNEGNISDIDVRVVALEAHATSGMTYKGNCTYANLPSSGMEQGDMWYVTDRYTYYAYDGSSWNDVMNLGISWQLDEDGDYCLYIDDGE